MAWTRTASPVATYPDAIKEAAARRSLAFAADQLEVARLLGDVRDDQPGYEVPRDQIAGLREQVDDDGASTGLFTRLKHEFKAFFQHSARREADTDNNSAQATREYKTD